MAFSDHLIDDMPESGRAQMAYDHVFRLFQLQIAGLKKDRSLTPYQRAAAIAALRQRQLMEAKGARDRVVDDERRMMRARRRLVRASLVKPDVQ